MHHADGCQQEQCWRRVQALKDLPVLRWLCSPWLWDESLAGFHTRLLPTQTHLPFIEKVLPFKIPTSEVMSHPPPLRNCGSPRPALLGFFFVCHQFVPPHTQPLAHQNLQDACTAGRSAPLSEIKHQEKPSSTRAICLTAQTYSSISQHLGNKPEQPETGI